jgi:hypothetical protein
MVAQSDWLPMMMATGAPAMARSGSRASGRTGHSEAFTAKQG